MASAEGNQKLFFFNYNGDTRKVQPEQPLNLLSDLVALLKSKYKEAGITGDEFEFWTTDKQYDVRHKLENTNDIYEGAVIEVQAPNAGAKRGREEASQPQAAVKKQRVMGPRHVLRLRGLPWETQNQQVREFFDGVTLVECHVIFLPNGRATGEAIVEVGSEEDFQKAMGKNNEHLGSRYIEVFKSSGEDMDRALGRVGPMQYGGMGTTTAQGLGVANPSNAIVRMRGLPFSALESDIIEFFAQAGVKPAKVHIIREEGIGRPSGNAYCEFEGEEARAQAMTLNRKNLGSRYIELFESRMEDLMRQIGYGQTQQYPSWGQPAPPAMAYGGAQQPYNPSQAQQPYNPYGGYGMQQGGAPPPMQAPQVPDPRGPVVPGDNCIRMRGLPFGCSEHDITQFFMEGGVTPVRIHRKADGAEAFVEFHDANDATKAMGRHKAYIKHRYIELFRVSASEVAQTVGVTMPPPQPQMGGYAAQPGVPGQPRVSRFATGQQYAAPTAQPQYAAAPAVQQQYATAPAGQQYATATPQQYATAPAGQQYATGY